MTPCCRNEQLKMRVQWGKRCRVLRKSTIPASVVCRLLHCACPDNSNSNPCFCDSSEFQNAAFKGSVLRDKILCCTQANVRWIHCHAYYHVVPIHYHVVIRGLWRQYHAQKYSLWLEQDFWEGREKAEDKDNSGRPSRSHSDQNIYTYTWCVPKVRWIAPEKRIYCR